MTMPEIKLVPSGRTIQADPASSLREALFPEGVEFMCSGKGACKGCRVRVLEGAWHPNDKEKAAIPGELLNDGWRLACQGRLERPLTLQIGQWETPLPAGSSTFPFIPGEGLGIAVDLGTTTIAAQLVDLSSAQVMAVATALNAQSVHGFDVMTRLEFAADGGAKTLQLKIRRQIGSLIDELLDRIPRNGRKLRKVTIAGNAAMHHLFCGFPVEPLTRYPFEPVSREVHHFPSEALGWSRCHVDVQLLPCLGGMVGGDTLAGILATGLHLHETPAALIDLGTNGEIVIGHRDRLLCTSAAAGPAFEGARISMGMRAATGAISRVEWRENRLECRLVHGQRPRGLCGSGLVDAIAVGLDLEVIQPNGRFAGRLESWPLAGRVSLAQGDIRELQLAKSAVTSGLLLICRELGFEPRKLQKVYLAGAFANYVSQRSARRIGLLPVPAENIVVSGNTALHGARLALFDNHQANLREITSLTRYIGLNNFAQFQETFVSQLPFPGSN